jgi:hypothetical protein
VAEAASFAADVDEVKRDTGEARDLWHAVYPTLSEGRPGLYGAITGRAEAHAMRLAMLYALLDRERWIGPEHLKAGLALWDYCDRSARFIFGDAIGDRTADEILDALQGAGDMGMTREEIRDLFRRHKSAAEIVRALAVLQDAGRARSESQPTAGRPAEKWFAVAR